MQSELVFLKDSYLKEIETVVLEKGENWVSVEKTIFYPEGGGQPSDSGKIEWNGNSSIVKEVKKEGGVIKHFLEGEIPKKNSKVKLILDWEKRFRLMRMHSAQHLLSGIILDKFGASTVGNQIHEDYSRMDFHPIRFTEEMIKKVEEEFNKAVKEEKEIKIYFTSREGVLKGIDEKRRRLFDSLPEFIKEIRVVEIVDWDKCPCAGTHVGNTREIGLIKIIKRETKGNERDRIVFELENE